MRAHITFEPLAKVKLAAFFLSVMLYQPHRDVEMEVDRRGVRLSCGPIKLELDPA